MSAARRRTPAPAATAAFALGSCSRPPRRAGADTLATGHYARIVQHRKPARFARTRELDPDKDQSYMLARLNPARLDQISLSRSARRRRPRRAPRPSAQVSQPQGAERARRRASSQATTTARSSSGAGSRREKVRSSTKAARCSASTAVTGASHRVSGRGSATARPSRSMHSARIPGRTPSWSAPWRRSPARRSRPQGTSTYRVDRAQAKLPVPVGGCSCGGPTADGGFRLELARPAYGVAPGQAAVLYEDDVVVGAGLIRA